MRTQQITSDALSQLAFDNRVSIEFRGDAASAVVGGVEYVAKVEQS